MKVILIGAGGVARELLPRLSELWNVTIIDPSAERIAALGSPREFRSIEGDGSSRVVLERAGLGSTDALMALTDDDDVNLEICRLARDAGIRRLAALVRNSSRQDDYRELGVPTVSAALLAARRIESHLERRRVVSTAFADGKAEGIEFRVSPDSPVCDKSLGELHARSFIVGAILRNGQLVVPHGETVLEADDFVTVVGAGRDFGEIVRTFTAGEQRFPLEYGKRVALAVADEAVLGGPYSEAVEIARNSQATSLLVLHRNPEDVGDDARAAEIRRLVERTVELGAGVQVHPRPVRRGLTRALASISGEESVGLFVVPAPRGGVGSIAGTLRAVGLVTRTQRPVLLARATHPYRRILVPGRDTPACRAAIRVAIDLARAAKGELFSLCVLDPLFLADTGREQDGYAVLSWIEEEAAVHGVPVKGRITRGNPVRRMLQAAEQVDLVVLGIGRRRRRLSLGVGIAELIARRTSKSVLLVPRRKPA